MTNSYETLDPLLVASLFQSALPPRKLDAHKGDAGSVAIVGGDSGMQGAVVLASRAALLMGAGRVYACMLASDKPMLDLSYPEIMLRTHDTLTQLKQLDALVLGPGLGQSQAAMALLAFWLKQSVPLLLDADALNLMAQHPHLVELCRARLSNTVITPHAAEAARLLGSSSAEIQKNRRESAMKLAEMLHASCVLKGAASLCAHYSGACFVNTSGNPSLATAGMGDVLSGMVGGFMAQGMAGLEAIKLAVFVHGAAADKLVSEGLGPHGLTASELMLAARSVLNQLNAASSHLRLP
ncbi:MAG: NAD(P)H-hydrate dehydratase [Methylotenera sp.]|nr:NAD(P)H-hydrate dehydratase [Methylotenera sp.]